MRRRTIADHAFSASRRSPISIVRDAARSQLDFVVSEVTDEFTRGRESLIVNAIRSVVAIPLRCEGSTRLLGVLYLDSQSRRHNFNRIGNDILQRHRSSSRDADRASALCSRWSTNQLF